MRTSDKGSAWWSNVSACAVFGLLLAWPGDRLSAAEAKPVRPDLTGVVKGQDRPLSGATVFIYTAGPKEGAGILCPSCYADCRKRATTDTEGRFKIESLDPTLVFRLLVVAKGHHPEFVNKVDPALKPVEVVLKPTKEAIEPKQQVNGRVVDGEGKAVSGAVVSIRGVTRGESTRFGANEDVDEVAVTDDAGRFVINGKDKFDAVGVEVEARALAKGIFQRLATGGKVHELKLSVGGAVKGRLVNNGQAVAGVEMGICGADRNAEVYVGDYSVGTDSEGRFLLVNLPPNREYFLYGRMESLRDKGALPARRVQVGDNDTVQDVGDVQVVTGYRLEGRLRLTDGKPIPPKTRVLLSRDEAWDSTQTETDGQGHFRFYGVPPESINLAARVNGYRLSPRNKSLDTLNPFGLTGRLHTNKTDLVVELEPGKAQSSRGEYIDLRQEPLMGVETGGARSMGDLRVTGTVVDAQTGQPLKAFTITEGRAEPFPQTFQWLTTRQTEGTNGHFEVFLTKGRTASAVSVAAEGYLPQASGAVPDTGTNINFALKRGTGPAGTILKPDGQPAADTTVYLADMRNGVYVQDPNMKVREHMYQEIRTTRTDAQGKFSFKATVSDYGILVLDDAGFAQVTVEELARNPQVKLQPWAKVEGKLLIGTHSGTNETIQLGLAYLPYQYKPREFAPLSLFLKTQTDQDGRFVFPRVPPINLQVYHSPNVREDKMGIIPMSQTTNFALKAGETKTLALGGQGRPVIGRLVLKGYEGEFNWRSDVYSIESILPPNEHVPDLLTLSREQSAKIQAADSDADKQLFVDEMQKTREEAIAKQRAFYATDEGRQYYFQQRRYALNFAKDGSFRIEDVLGGKYRLRLDLREGGGGAMRFSAPLIATLNKEFDVPASSGGRSDEPFDLGTLELQARKTLTLGKVAPPFEVKTIDERTVKLSDFAGKYLLLDFWAVWCGPCVAETPYLKATYEAFKDEPRFRMLGLSLDPNIKAPLDFVRKNQIGWTIGFLGDWSKTDLPTQYGVEGIPAIFLLGPDGKIVAKDLRGENIKAAVARALAKNESANAR